MRHGLQEERSTIIDYTNEMAKQQQPVTVVAKGLQVSHSNPWLAASTDGIVCDPQGREIGLLEVKNLLKDKGMKLREAAKKEKSFCLEIVAGKMMLKKTHNYYHQVQGQLHIWDFAWCDFVVRCTNPHDLHTERIFKDGPFWEECLTKLQAFYEKVLLPELASPRHGKQPGIRQPVEPWVGGGT